MVTGLGRSVNRVKWYETPPSKARRMGLELKFHCSASGKLPAKKSQENIKTNNLWDFCLLNPVFRMALALDPEITRAQVPNRRRLGTGACLLYTSDAADE